ncbi:MAG: acyl carrier protein [Oscillospiraceae bacterium]|nr:acyl carrier protein [Oscillospiraceae bacterium]MBQ6849941.1 acyl carrier protein [Oscillospiraceae bacterium]MBR6610367.1 acyl carrier protein [Oscillospiraceae bacterium]
MNRTEIMAKLNEIFCDVFDDEDIVLTDATNSDDIEDWDSLEQINLLVAIEKQFSIKFSLADVADLENVGAMVDLIERMVG